MYPKVSVITPTYKRAHFLLRAIDSVLNQTYPNIQVVVVDNNADLPEFREETAKAMEKYKDDDRVVYIQSAANLGGGGARNIGTEACDGEYVTFLDDDDEYLPPKIESQLKFMMMHDLDFSLTDVCMFDKNGNFSERRSRPFIKDWSAESLFKNHAVYSLTPTSTYMIKRDCLFEIGGFRNVPMGQEFMLMWDALEYAKLHPEKRFGYLPCSYIKAYLHDEGRISVSKDKIKWEEMIYRIKLSKADELSAEEIKYIDFRHYSVLAFVNLRWNSKKGFLINIAKAVMVSPSYSLTEFKKYIKNR